MKMQPDRLDGVNMISRTDGANLWVHQTAFQGPLLVPHVGNVQVWPVQNPTELCAADFAAVVALRPELLIIGTGPRLRFPPAAQLRPLIEARIGYEVMDTPAAARTYNILASEGRSVMVALLPIETASP